MGGTATIERPGAGPPQGSGGSGDAQPSVGILLAGLLAGAGIIHLVMVPAHLGDSWLDPFAFAVVGWLQLGAALALVLGRGSRSLYVATIVGNLAVVGLWIWSRTAGLPVGAHAGVVEDVGAVDGVAAALEVAAVLVAAAMVTAPSRLRVGVLGPALAAVAVLGLTTAAIVSPDAASHGGHDHGTDAAHDGTATHAADMVTIDSQRCDLGFNPRSYWEDAPRMGVDTYAGGTMGIHATPTLMDQVTATDAFEGRGSPGLDQLIAATSEAAGGEAAAARLIDSLSNASTEDYEAWVRWTGDTALAAAGGSSGGHAHGAASASGGTAASTNAAAPDDNHGHGGHAGPQPWVAMVDQDQCVTLSKELELARTTALAYPTAADAMAAGWVRVTNYVPGIAAHYMNFGLVDGTFTIDEPEMILYDGDDPDARVVGLSYYMIHAGEAEPSQGFTGANDHFHRHVGLCTKPGAGVIGDSTTTAEQCRAMGGFKADGSKGWMSHAWVVPGCESPWGVFSGASPVLDRTLADASGTNDGACSASGVRDRYDLRPAGKETTGTGESAGGD